VTVKAQIQSRPGPVQVVLQAFMVSASVKDGCHLSTDADFERYGAAAIRQWDEFVATCREAEPALAECALAESVVDGLRKQEVWGKILRGCAQ
jgi:hypothetical protein